MPTGDYCPPGEYFPKEAFEKLIGEFATTVAFLKNKPAGLAQFIRLREDAKLPTSAYDTDSGYDLYAVEDKMIQPNGSAVVDVGLQVAYIKEGYWFSIEARSGLGFKHGIQPHPGIIDQSYRGPLSIKLYDLNGNGHYIQKGERIAQIVFYQLVKGDMLWATEVKETARGGNGLGSSGK